MTAAGSSAPSLNIGQYWDTAEVPPSVAGLCATFRDLNPEFHHRVFSEADVERLIATHFGPRELAAFRTCAVPSMQSDYFRYCFVLSYGGIYADADFRCARPLRPLLEEAEAGEVFIGSRHTLEDREADRIWSGFFAFRQPGHPLLKLALEIATANLEARIAERVWPAGDKVRPAIWLTVGPGIFSAMRWIREWGSFDAFIDAIAGTVAEPFGSLYCEVIGDYRRVAEAFEGVRVSPLSRMLEWVDEVPVDELPYKQTDSHWHNVEAEIFR